jgi:KUP system potassium uptake protein
MSTTKATGATLALGALGVVFGDIGTSPLYAFNAVFGGAGRHLPTNQSTVLGIVSLVVWSVTLVVSIKFLGFIMGADNGGEGGIMALVTDIKERVATIRYGWLFVGIGLIGVSLFYGDSTITPAISVLSAVEGLKVTAPALSGFVLPCTVVILVSLFAIQRYGTALLGRLFGPVMLIWFLTIAIGGAIQVTAHPAILRALSPLVAIGFFIAHPLEAFLAMGVIVLVVTGAEALYADMGHFGRGPISRAWFAVVFPALLLCYLGQGALIQHDPRAAASPLLLLYPAPIRLPILFLATLATVIASQSVISGAFSLTRQAVQLNFLPKMLVTHTSSTREGQVYIPFVNTVLAILVVTLVIVFGSSARLANAYGIAVSGTLLVDTILYLVVVRTIWHKSPPVIFLACLAFLPLDLLFVAATLPKLTAGGWFPVLIGAIICLVIATWLQGERLASAERIALEGSLADFVAGLRHHKPHLIRLPGVAVYVGHHPGLTPLALRATVNDMHELAEKVIVVSVETAPSAHIPEERRAVVDDEIQHDGITYVRLTYGFHDSPNVPKSLGAVGLGLDIDEAHYFNSTSRIVSGSHGKMAPWRKHLFRVMSQNALSASDYYRLPVGRTVDIETLIAV